MKENNCIFKTIFAVLLTLTVYSTRAQIALPSEMDSVKICLLTCGPGNEVWSLYGHTAIRIENRINGTDIVVNYGTFSLKQKMFVLRFIFGLTDYSMGICGITDFIAEYTYEGRWVKQQELNLLPEEKMNIVKAIEINARPENINYRYNFFYNNCTTRARDLIVRNINGEVIFENKIENSPSFRTMIHGCNEHDRWARFGNDLLLGIKADYRTSRSQQQFLPANLERDFSNASIAYDNGKRRKLVSGSSMLIPESIAKGSTGCSSESIVTPLLLSICLLIAVAVATLVQLLTKRRMWILDSILMVSSGLAGVILFAMLFSSHPTVNLNLQILILNPISLILAYNITRNGMKGKGHWYWKVTAACCILFLIGNSIQVYAEGMNILALSLLIRSVVNSSKAYK